MVKTKEPKEKKTKIKKGPKGVEKNEFKTQANFTLRELEAESSTLKVYRHKIQNQLHFLNIEEILLRKHLEIWESNKNLTISEIKKKITEETNRLKRTEEKKPEKEDTITEVPVQVVQKEGPKPEEVIIIEEKTSTKK